MEGGVQVHWGVRPREGGVHAQGGVRPREGGVQAKGGIRPSQATFWTTHFFSLPLNSLSLPAPLGRATRSPGSLL